MWFRTGIRRVRWGLLLPALFYLLVMPARAEKVAELKTDAIGCQSRETAESLAQAVWRGDQEKIIAILKEAGRSGNCKRLAKDAVVEVHASHVIKVSRMGRSERPLTLVQIRELGHETRYWVMTGKLLLR